MKIILFINKDFEANLAYNLLKRELSNHNVKIYYSESVGNTKSKPEELLKLEYYEKEFFFGDLAETIRRNGIKTEFEFFNDEFKSFKFSKCTNVNSPAFINEVRQFKPDLFISIRFGKIFKNEIIGIPLKGILNLHSAILPDYKGILGTLHNLKDNKSHYGCTLHYIDDNTIDTGQIITIAKRPVNKKRSLFWHVVKLYPLGCNLILDSIRKLKTIDRLPSTKQDMTKGNYFTLPKKADFKKLYNCNIKYFDLDDYKEIIGDYISPEVLNKLDIKRNTSPNNR